MPGASPRFIHLRTHTEHSLLEGAVPVKKLVDLCVKSRMPAVAVTDTNNMFAALEFSVAAMATGVQPILGCQISVAHDPAQPGERPRLPAPIVLLAVPYGAVEELLEGVGPLPASTVLIDATNPFGSGKLLPQGILREPVENLARASAIVLTKADLVPLPVLWACMNTRPCILSASRPATAS